MGGNGDFFSFSVNTSGIRLVNDIFLKIKKIHSGGGSRNAEKKGNILIEPNVVIFHNTPMSPFEGHNRGTAINLQHLPREGRHHSFEGFVGGGKVGVGWTVVFVGGDDGIVSSYFEHCGERWLAVSKRLGLWMELDRRGLLRGSYCVLLIEVVRPGSFG